MKYAALLTNGLWRKPASTVLTGLSIAVAFLLFGLLQGTTAVFDQAISRARADRLAVTSRTSSNDLLPFSHLANIERVSGVKVVSHNTLLMGFFQNPAAPVRGVVVDPERYFKAYPELHVSTPQLEAMERTRTGILVGQQLAMRMGWKVGDRVPIQSRFWKNGDKGATWTFDIVGTYDSPGVDSPQTSVYLVNYAYFDEARTAAHGMIGGYIVQIDAPEHAAKVSQAIDGLFENSAGRTRTQSENELARARLREIGDVQFIVNTVLAAVFFTLVLVTANSVSQSVNERIPEFGALKAIGFTDIRVFALIFSEALILFEIAALVGLVATILLFAPAMRAVFGPGGGALPTVVLWWGVALAAAAALISVASPALRAMRKPVAEALANR